MWLMMMVVLGKAAAKSANSPNWVWYTRASKLKPILWRRSNPSRNRESCIIPGELERPRVTSGLASQAHEKRMPRKRLLLAAIWASSTG